MSYNPRRGTYSVPTGRPLLLKELRAKNATIGDALNLLYAEDDPAKFDELADELYSAFRIAANLAPTRAEIECKEHPRGAVDPDPPEGWGTCLLCNLRRRKGRRVPSPAHSHDDEESSIGYTMPPAPYSFEMLKSYVYGANELIFDLALDSTTEEFAAVTDELHHSFVIARELGRERPRSRCERHPGAPLDPTAGNRCLFCLNSKRPSTGVVTLLRPTKRRRLGRPRDDRDSMPPQPPADQ